jgi:hypothetical protein
MEKHECDQTVANPGVVFPTPKQHLQNQLPMVFFHNVAFLRKNKGVTKPLPTQMPNFPRQNNTCKINSLLCFWTTSLFFGKTRV